MNKHFASIGHNLANLTKSPKIQFYEYLNTINVARSFYFTPVAEDEILTEIILTPSNKSYGLYSCSVNILKLSKHIISKPLVTIINNSIQSGVHPSKLKI